MYNQEPQAKQYAALDTRVAVLGDYAGSVQYMPGRWYEFVETGYSSDVRQWTTTMNDME